MRKASARAPSFFVDEDLRQRYLAAYEHVLAGWPVPYDRLSVPTDLGTTHVIVCGSPVAPPVVLLHAAMATATIWRPNVVGLSSHFRVYAVDVIGQGGLSVATRKIRTRHDYIGWMNSLFDELGIAKASIVGNSYGGFLAFNQASLAPDRVERIVAISPPGVFVSLWRLAPRFIWGTARELARRLRGGRRKKRSIADFLAPGAQFREEDAAWIALSEQFVNGGVRMNAAMPTVFSKSELQSIVVPAMLLIAEHETMYDPNRTLRIACSRMPALRAEIVEGAHHLAAMARPEFVNDTILRFLGSAPNDRMQPLGLA
jgi:pimeloyl-ACP methyl ester carboxylesterase